MSVEAVSWVLRQSIKQSSAKFVLVAIANCADGKEFVAWPSIAYIVEATSQDRKTVIANIKKLIDWGYIEDTGERKGVTNQVIVYRLKNPENGPIEQYRKRNSTENGTVPEFPGNSTVFPIKQSQNSLETVPKTGHGTVRNRKEPSGNNGASDFNALGRLIQSGVSKEVATDWLALRKQKKAAVTETAIKGVEREAIKAGISLSEALELGCMRGWIGFKADWYTKDAGNAATGRRGLVL